MGVKISANKNIATALLEGDIDHHTAKPMRETIDSFVERMHPKLLELDFSKIQFMDSSGIGLIMGRYRLMKQLNGSVKLINVPDRIEKVIKLSGLGVLGLC